MPQVDLSDKLRVTRSRVALEQQQHHEPESPMYARLERKDVRLRADQIAQLAELVRELMRARKVKVERITENTLIRVAVDLLLTHRAQLRGGTERELRNSVSPGVRHSPTDDRTGGIR